MQISIIKYYKHIDTFDAGPPASSTETISLQRIKVLRGGKEDNMSSRRATQQAARRCRDRSHDTSHYNGFGIVSNRTGVRHVNEASMEGMV